jgi:DNA-binding response OmpR family regulator
MQNLIIYKFTQLYDIFEEISFYLNFKITYVDNQNSLNDKLKILNNSLIISNKRHLNLDNQFVLENTPMNIIKLLEEINIKFLKLKSNTQSKIVINKYLINLNSREISYSDFKVKLTEKEIDIIIYLFNAKKSVEINELQKKVWSYQTDIETHTVETHIYRLRKKILSTFGDDKFIFSNKKGYQIY